MCRPARSAASTLAPASASGTQPLAARGNSSLYMSGGTGWTKGTSKQGCSRSAPASKGGQGGAAAS
eukprot:193646-Chlamydomonas_euryale.AAC.4